MRVLYAGRRGGKGAALARLLDRDLDRQINAAPGRPRTAPLVPGPSAPSYTVRPGNYADDMHAIQRDLKR